MKLIRYILYLLLFFPVFSFAYGNAGDYNVYHRNIIEAERQIFLAHQPSAGLQFFKQTFSDYDFVFVDDCIEAFQLALFFKREDMAMVFIKKALENGFELKFLDELSLGCPCDFYKDAQGKVTIHRDFIHKNTVYLNKYADDCYKKYIDRINVDLVAALLKRHVKEQLFKNYIPGLMLTGKRDEMRAQNIAYLKVSDDNLHYIDSLSVAGVYTGEKNLGIYTNKQATYLPQAFTSIENYLKILLSAYGLNTTQRIPINTEVDYYDKGPVYIMLFHNPKSFAALNKTHKQAIASGYLHPREYASLMYNVKGSSKYPDIYLMPSTKKVDDLEVVNMMRDSLLLPSYELDEQKHLFAHEHRLRLFFGMFSGTR